MFKPGNFFSPKFLKSLGEISLLWLFIYYVLKFIRSSRAIQALKAMVVLLGVFLLTHYLGLEVITWIIYKIFAISVIALLIIFQPELRNGLIRLGGGSLWGLFLHQENNWDALIKGLLRLSDKKIGCLIAIQREVDLGQYIDTGAKLDSLISPEIIESIFYPGNPLHDGGVIIRGQRIVAAGCLFPVSTNPYLSKTMGMRHRAAVGLSEESDALVIVVSEENGAISLAQKGILRLDVDEKILRTTLSQFFQSKTFRKT
ncbi:MAG: diadenylate cyclase CdaA [Candidatus Omnitrophica bacterium]|nr:diadenylate cyclase CdaA [Candidatus Omnitrophota bacterium]MCM8792990.1 diadenylate cyclase CdaA [Candidatus Omnitrophota bacterium]